MSKSKSTRRGVTAIKLVLCASAGVAQVPLFASSALAGGFGAATSIESTIAFKKEYTAAGDFNGDGRDDIAYFLRSGASSEEGDVYVGLSRSGEFAVSKWHHYFGVENERPVVGNVDGDSRDDIVTISPDGRVWVARSTGAAFSGSSTWLKGWPTTAVTKLADINGDGRDDLVGFYRSSASAHTGDVIVAISNGSVFATPYKAHESFSVKNEQPETGDFNGDGKADIVTFIKDEWPDRAGQVLVSLSNGSRFGAAQEWHAYFGLGSEEIRVADVNADARDDIITFVGANSEQNPNKVYVATSTGAGFSRSSVWHDELCDGSDRCLMADVNGDDQADAVVFNDRLIPIGGRTVRYVSVAFADGVDTAQDYDLAKFGFNVLRTNGKTARGERPLLTVMMGFSDASISSAHSVGYYQEHLFDTAPSVQGYFTEQSHGIFTFRNVGIVRVSHPDTEGTAGNESKIACAFGEGNGCVGSGGHVRKHAVEQAGRVFDFARFDANGDGKVTTDELTVLVVHAARTQGGGGQSGPFNCTVPVNNRVEYCPSSVSGVSEFTDFETISHELSHTLGTIDVYHTSCDSNRATLMSCTGGDAFQHLDPWHKMALGWVVPRVYRISRGGGCGWLQAAGHGKDDVVLLYDPVRNDSEFFMLEYRSPTMGGLYDRSVGDVGVAVWQVALNPSTRSLAFGNPQAIDSPRGGDGVLNSSLRGDDVVDGTTIRWGANRTLDSTPSGDDVYRKEPMLTVLGSPTAGAPHNNWQGISNFWVDGHLTTPLSWADRSRTDVYLDAGAPRSISQFIGLSWRRGADVVDPVTNDPDVAACYGKLGTVTVGH